MMEIHLMHRDDISAGMRLSGLAGWNQTDQDWRRFLMLEPEGCFAAVRDGIVCGTVTTLQYQDRFGWIGMLLVDPAYRGRGIGTSLLQRGMNYLRVCGIEALRLDATPMGRPLYLQLGFADEYPVERWEGIAGTQFKSCLQSMTPAQLDRVCRWDCEVFGADRSRLLKCLWSEGPHYSAVIGSGAKIRGYVLGRAGARAHYLGPWVAEPGSSAAEQLFNGMQSRFGGETVFLDIPGQNDKARELVAQAGFVHQRTLERMVYGPLRYSGRPDMICGIAGPELG